MTLNDRYFEPLIEIEVVIFFSMGTGLQMLLCETDGYPTAER